MPEGEGGREGGKERREGGRGGGVNELWRAFFPQRRREGGKEGGREGRTIEGLEAVLALDVEVLGGVILYVL